MSHMSHTSKMAFKFVLALALVVAVSCDVPYEPSPRPDAWWTQRHEGLLAQTKAHAAQEKVVFLGDSITEGWAGNGKAVWAEHYAPRGAYNYGIGGDRTEHILWRIAHGEFEGVNPKLIVLKIGTNNLYSNTVADIAKGIKAILDSLHTKMPNAKVLLLSVLPRQPENADQKVHEINALIKRYADNKQVHYLDLAIHFELSLGHEIAELFTPDHVHLTAKGYEMWYKVMEPSFKELIA